MPDTSISPQSYAGGRPLLDRLLPSWIVRYFSRGRAPPSAPIASSAAASSTTAPGDDSDGSQPHPRPPASTAVVCPSASASPSAEKRPSLRERLSISQGYRRLSRSFASSSRYSPQNNVQSPSPIPMSGVLQQPTSSATDTGSNPPTQPPSSVDVTPGITAPSSDVQDASASLLDASTDVPDTPTGPAASLIAADAPTTASPLDAADAPAADPMAEMWTEAVVEWQRKTGLDLAVPDAIPLRSKEAVMSYIAKMEMEENESEKGGWEMLRERVDPLARILEKLCNPIGDTISAAFPPSSIIFAAVGLIVSAYTRTREDFAQIGDAFHEIRFHLQVVETVADSHLGDLLRTACVLLLTKVLAVLGIIAEMRREGYLRQWLSRISSQTRPLSEALQNLRLLATNQQQAMAAVTLNKVTHLMESIASDKVSQEWIRGCLADVLRATREIQDIGSSTQSGIIAHRAALRRMELMLYNESDKLRKIEMFAECQQIKEWLQYVDPSYRLRKLLDDRVEGTGSWFLDGDEFAALKEGKTKAVLLNGKAGSGKSTIIAAAVEALRAYHACDPYSIVLAHVFDSTSASCGQRDLHSLLSTLLCQLALNNTHCASIISESHKTIAANGLPTKARMEGLLMETLRATSLHITIVIDALDESSDEADIVSFLQRLESVSATSVLASRRPATDSTQSYGCVVTMDNYRNNDIRSLLDIAMSQGGDLERVQLDREGVRDRLLAGAEGNFRWAALVIHELRAVAGIPTKVLCRLQSLPKSLQALYQQCLDSIRDDDRDDVRRLLLWLVRSEVPLPLNDFAKIMAFDYSDDIPIYHASHRPLPEAVTNMVGSMLVCVDEGIVRLAHASVRDFLLDLPSNSPFFICKDTDYTLMARTVLAYLAAIDQMTSFDHESPLTYAWVHYVHKAGTEFYNDLLKEAKSVISKVVAYPLGTAVANKSLWTAASIGDQQLVAALVDGDGVYIECTHLKERTSLHIAAINGHIAVASLLLERGATPTARDWFSSTPLDLAVYEGHAEMARLLLDKGAQAGESNDYGETALHHAACEGYLGIITLLLERGASISARTSSDQTPLMQAADCGREDVVRLLLDKGAHIEDYEESRWTSLHCVARSGHLNTARLLLEQGASISARTSFYDTPLMVAAYHGQLDIVRLLLDKGANIEDHDKDGLTSLHLTAVAGNKPAQLSAGLLLERGASIDARTKNLLTPLMIASKKGRSHFVRLFLDNGAQVQDCDEDGSTSLHFAARWGYTTDISELLLERGASIDARDKRQRTPLIAAVGCMACDHRAAIRLLLDKGAHIEECDEKGWTSLHYAAQRGHLGIASLLLKRGASVDARANHQLTPLMIATKYGQEGAIRLLLDKGAHIERCDEKGWTSLHFAALREPLDICSLLLERGAPVDARDKNQLTPLIIAADCGRADVVGLLLDKGAHTEVCWEHASDFPSYLM